jgi:hypothetical protein
MPQTQISCPRCRQPIAALVEQLFDVSSDPGAKQRLLGGVSNYARCPMCGFEGPIATPIVYHDNEKELLLTYFPAELGMPVNEQEKLIGPHITQVTNRLPAEKRKAYLLSPQNHLTYQSLIERVLGADGITPEMIKAQQDRMGVVERLLTATSDDVRKEIIKQDARLLDQQFFVLFSRLMQNIVNSGQEQLAQQFAAVQELLMAETEIGRKLKSSVSEMEAAAKSLQEAGKELTREKLLDLMIAAPSEERLKALTSMARPGMDYSFFQELTDRIDKLQGDEKKRLEDLRERLLDYINEIDKQMEARYAEAQKFVETILAAEDVRAATMENLENFTQEMVDVLGMLLRQAAEKNDTARMQKLQQVAQVLQEASAPPPEVALIEKLMDAPDNQLDALLAQNEALVNDTFMQSLGTLVAQMDAQIQAGQVDEDGKAAFERLQAVHRAALRFSMKKQMK